MTTIRVAKRTKFTVVHRSSINDDRLSFRATGLLVWLLDKPDDWKVSAEAICLVKKEGRDAIRASLVELEQAGYLIREKTRGTDGKWHAFAVLYEMPVDKSGSPQRETSAGQPAVVSQASIRSTETRRLNSVGSPKTVENPRTDERGTFLPGTGWVK